MIHEKSADTKIIESILAEAKVGDVITYEALSKAIGRDVRQFAFSSLRTARQGLLKDKSLVFGTIQNEGLQRLDDVGIVKSSECDRRRLSRASKRALRKLSAVKFDALPEDAKRQHVITSAQMGAIQMFASKNAETRIASAVDGNTKQLAIGDTLKMFGG